MELGIFSTPIQELSENINGNNIFIKRDDLLPFSFGGNKARKAILFFEDLDKKKADCVVTYGSNSSNHCRIIANIAATKNLPCYIISPSESTHSTSNSKMSKLFGAVTIQCPISEVSSTIEKKLTKLKADGCRPYFIQGGGHGDIGTHSYVKVYDEIVDYERKTGIYFDFIFHTSGTGTTQAGLICGSLLRGDERRIIGISAARKKYSGENTVLESVNSYLQNMGETQVTIDEVSFIDDYVLSGYGDYNDEILLTIKEVLIHEGIPLDRIYTGKGFWGMKEYIKTKNITEKKILFIHTGGTPLFFDGLEELISE